MRRTAIATLIELGHYLAEKLSDTAGRHCAVLLNGEKVIAYALQGLQKQDNFCTAAVSLMQSKVLINRGWLALSYRPTAACIGMAQLLGIRRIVWRQGDINHSAIITAQSITFDPVDKALFFQGYKGTEYHLPWPLPKIEQFHPISCDIMKNVFHPPPETANLVQSMIAADEVVKSNTCLLLAFAIALIGHGPRAHNANRASLYDGQNIASVLVDNEYRIVGWGINTNSLHTTLHGEMNLIRSYQAGNMNALPAGGKLFTTLEPCSMCAGMIVHTAGPGNDFEVVSGQKDEQVGHSYLRNPTGFDGCTNNQRTVTSTISTIPILPNSQIGAHMTSSQFEHSPPPVGGAAARPMQTTRYLELHGREIMSDAVKLLNMTATMWVPSTEQVAWRANRDKFLEHVSTSIRG